MKMQSKTAVSLDNGKIVRKKTGIRKNSSNGNSSLRFKGNGYSGKEKTKQDVRVGKIMLHITNEEKVYWPGENILKKDLIGYYSEVADFILPYLKNRAESLHRFPNGIKGMSFYQKNMEKEKIPSWLTTEKIFSESNHEYLDYLICNDKATLIYMANLGCIEMNPWNSKIKKLDYPDWVVLDLDPEQIEFREVARTAIEIKKTLDEIGIKCYPKTSGATGMHVYVPLGANYTYEEARKFGQLIAELVNEKLPATTSLIRSPAKRQKKVYIDYLQNSRGQTLASPYSVRPRPGATVSTPLFWKEVNDKLDPGKFTLKTILNRLDKVGDLWKPVLGKGENIKAALKKLKEADVESFEGKRRKNFRGAVITSRTK